VIDFTSHETSPETMRATEVVARHHAVIDPFYRCLAVDSHTDRPFQF
jgi:hypothetical protein